MYDKTIATTSTTTATRVAHFDNLPLALVTLDPFHATRMSATIGDDRIVRGFVAHGEPTDDRVPWHRYQSVVIGGV